MIDLTDCCILPHGSCSRPAVCWYSRISGHIPFSYVDFVAADGWPPLAVFGYCKVHDADLRRHPHVFNNLHCAYSTKEAEVMLVMHS